MGQGRRRDTGLSACLVGYVHNFGIQLWPVCFIIDVFFNKCLIVDVTLTLDMHDAAYMIDIHRHSNIEEPPPFINTMVALMGYEETYKYWK